MAQIVVSNSRDSKLLARSVDRLLRFPNAKHFFSQSLVVTFGPDLPVDEAGEWIEACARAGVAPVFLAAPNTSPERLGAIARASRGFVYCVSLTGVTGARHALGADVAAFVARVRRHTALPIAVGFGISAAEHVASLRGIADAVVVGSAALDAVSAAPADRRPAALRQFVAMVAAAGSD